MDWIAVTTARMKGWKTNRFLRSDFIITERLGTAERSPVAASFSYGEKDYYLGGSPLWQIFRVSYRRPRNNRSYGIALLAGYIWAALRRVKRAVSPELMRFHRREQMRKLKSIFHRLLRFKRVDSFSLVAEES